MSTMLHPAAGSLSVSALSRETFGHLFRLALCTGAAAGMRAARLTGEWRRRAGSRRTLAQMSAREWSDLGLTASDVRVEVEKPFWRP